jgi:N-acetylglucosamine kinase-like BadF-type ATPase
MIFVGVDGGTSHMESVVIDASGAVLGRGRGGPSNHPLGSGMHPRVGDHLVSAIGEALAAARLTASDVTAVSLNLSGRREELTIARARAWLAPLGLTPTCQIEVGEDHLSAWAAAGFPDPAIWVLLGTHWGSGGIVDGRVVDHPLDCAGLDQDNAALAEGAVIGSLAISAALRSQLGGPPTRLYAALCTSLGVEGIEGLIRWARAHTGSDQRASLCALAAQVAQEGDAVARELFRRAGEGLGAATVTMGRYLGVATRPATIVLAGQVWQAGEILLEPFRRTVLAGLPQAVVHLNRLTQAHGAALLALRLAGIMPGDDVFARLAAS